MKSLVPLFQILKGFKVRALSQKSVVGSVPIWIAMMLCGTAFAQTIYVTPKGGVPSAWELVSVEPDRIVVRKGGARFEFSREQIDLVTNPEATRLIESADRVMAEVEKQDPATFQDLEPQLTRLLPNLDAAAKRFDWVIPGVVDARNRVARAREGVEKTLDLTGSFEQDIRAIERMALGRTPVASNWEEVVDNTLSKAGEIPFDRVRDEVISEIERFRRTIRLSLVRRTEETERRVRERGEALLSDLDQGKIDEGQWSLILRDLRRQVSEQVPDPDLRLELEGFLDRVEGDSQAKLARAQSIVAQREIGRAMEAVESLTLDTTRTEEFQRRAEEVALKIAELPESNTKESLLARLESHRSDHAAALALIERTREPGPEAPAVAPAASPPRSLGWQTYLTDWRVLAGGTAVIVVVLLLLQRLLSKSGAAKPPSQIEDVKEAGGDGGQQGWAGGQDDLMSMLGGEEQKKEETPTVLSIADEPPAEAEEDPFGLSASSEPTASATDDLFQSDAPAETAPESSDAFGFSTEEPTASPEEDPLSMRSEPSQEDGGEDDPFGSIFTSPEPAPEEPKKSPEVEDPDDPFGLLQSSPQSEPPQPDEERIDDLFDPTESEPEKEPPKPDKEKKKAGDEEEDIFGFGSYFDSSESDSEKDR